MPRCLPPTAVPFTLRDLVAGCATLGRRRDGEQEDFRAELSRYLGVKHVFLSSSGKAALVQLLCAMAQLRPGKNEVLLPAYTSFSVPSAVVRAGLKITFYDLDPETLSPNLPSLAAAVSPATLCVVVCHLYGFPADVAEVRAVLGDSAVFLIDDAAQALGARYQGKLVGTNGDAGLFSLGRGKPLSAVEGGVAVIHSAELAAAVAAIPLTLLPWHHSWQLAFKALALFLLQRPAFYWIPRSLPFLKLGESVFSPDFPVQEFTVLQAVIGRRMLLRVDEINQKRHAVADLLMERLPLEWKQRLIRPLADAEPIYLRLPMVDERLPTAPALGIVSSYPLPLNVIDTLQSEIFGRRREYSGAALLAAQLRTLPTHDFVSVADVDAIVATLASVTVTNHRTGQ